MTLRVVIAEDDYLVREGVQRLLTNEPGIDLVAGYGDAASLLSNFARDEPDVVVTDIRMPPSWEAEGLALARELQVSAPDTAVVVLSQVVSAEHAGEIFRDGAAGRAYLLKEKVADRSALIGIIEQVAAGESYVDAEVVASLVAARRASPSPLDELTSREREVLALVAEGLSNTAIARRLHLAKRSVEGHINSIFAKLALPDETQVSRRVAAALLFLSAAQPS